MALLALVAAGCSPAGAPATGDAGTAATESESQAAGPHSYTVRGLVRQIPAEGNPGQQLLILHEPILDWVNEDGYETGMPSMTMPFPPADDVDLSDIEPGDTVEFTFRVDFENAPRLQLTAIREIVVGDSP
jgi:Cu/Ag efflux protein CusF